MAHAPLAGRSAESTVSHNTGTTTEHVGMPALESGSLAMVNVQKDTLTVRDVALAIPGFGDTSGTVVENALVRGLHVMETAPLDMCHVDQQDAFLAHLPNGIGPVMILVSVNGDPVVTNVLTITHSVDQTGGNTAYRTNL